MSDGATMPKSTHDITYVYLYDGRRIELTRHHVGTAYARNGNVGNPTEYFRWYTTLDGERVATTSSRAKAYEAAREVIEPSLVVPHYDSELKRHVHGSNRPFTTIAAEMQNHYVQKITMDRQSDTL